MQLESFQYLGKGQKQGWTINGFPELDSENTLILVFAAPEFINNPEPLLDLAKSYPKSSIIGCSTAGEISGSLINDHSLSVAVIKFEKTAIKTSMVKVESAELSLKAGKQLAADLDHPDLKGIFVLSDGLKINGSELVKGLGSITPKDAVITGGLAGDGSDFKQTWILMKDKIRTDHVVAVGFYGDHVQIGHGSRGGWDIFGPERRVTRSKGNILYELDGKPALPLYKEYLGEQANELPAAGLLFPLAIRHSRIDKNKLVRTILGVDEQTNALIFAGDMPQGYLAQLMRANFDRIIDGASNASKLSLQKHHENLQTVLIAISCVGRRLLLGERTEEETETTLDAFPKGTQQVGFYSYGEISPVVGSKCELHNQTMTLTSISEVL